MARLKLHRQTARPKKIFQDSPFLDLPGEIRELIYRAALTRPEPINLSPFETITYPLPQAADARITTRIQKDLKKNGPSETVVTWPEFRDQKDLEYVRKEMATGLLGTCKQVYFEAVNLFWRENVWRFEADVEWRVFRRWLCSIGPQAVGRLRRVEVFVPLDKEWYGWELGFDGKGVNMKNEPKLRMTKIPKKGVRIQTNVESVCLMLQEGKAKLDLTFVLPRKFELNDVSMVVPSLYIPKTMETHTRRKLVVEGEASVWGQNIPEAIAEELEMDVVLREGCHWWSHMAQTIETTCLLEDKEWKNPVNELLGFPELWNEEDPDVCSIAASGGKVNKRSGRKGWLASKSQATPDMGIAAAKNPRMNFLQREKNMRHISRDPGAWPTDRRQYDGLMTSPRPHPDSKTSKSAEHLRHVLATSKPNMLLLHQTGTVKIGEVIRYTVTYTPSQDRILPPPTVLHLRIKNTCAVALRAAFVHGPYTLYTAAFPAAFKTDKRWEHARTLGVPEFEPQLKAGGTWACVLKVPESIRGDAGTARGRTGRADDVGEKEEGGSVSWIIEVASQVIFSNSAGVHYEILLGRDEKSLHLGFGGSVGAPQPGQLSDHQQSIGAKDGTHNAQPKGVYSKAIMVKVEDTAGLWNTPKLPEWRGHNGETGREKDKQMGDDKAVESVVGQEEDTDDSGRRKRQKKVHLVVLTHGLHSNLGADMLFLKESIDATAKQAKIDAKVRRAKRWAEKQTKAEAGQKDHDGNRKDEKGNVKHPVEQRDEGMDESDDEEEVIVRGFSGNAVRTERGIKYLGKRLARYVLAMTYPDQPYKPTTKKLAAEALSHALKPDDTHADGEVKASHHHSTVLKEPYHDKKLAYTITSISFIAHSLGGLVQTYAVAYIQKHSPDFFDRIKPINFIALASPFLGLSNENPLYVKFALDFGLVGRTGQDLGLTWRAPTIARSGWGAIVGGISETAQRKIEGENPPESKPLLRILPTGPAHVVLKKFRNRTVYSNVVNDGIVPLRTSCLLFLDWQGLGRVEKARRENGLVGTMAGWGWAELTGANSSSPIRRDFSESAFSDAEDGGENTPTKTGHGSEIPQPPADATEEDDNHSLKSAPSRPTTPGKEIIQPTLGTSSNDGPLDRIIKFFQPSTSNPTAKTHHSQKQPKIYKRSQTIRIGSDTSTRTLSTASSTDQKEQNKVTTGDVEHEDPSQMSAPPKTTFFESAGDLLKPPLPSVEFLIDPKSRPRTIFHDRVYHPEDIPPPPLKKRPATSLLRRRSSSTTEIRPQGLPKTESDLSRKDYDDTKNTNPNKDPLEVVDGSAMKVEEKIARAYHRDLSWRKVLVRLEPDAHNNMIVRRMFANAYGWPVVKHLCDTHFSDSAVANRRDEDESSAERAKSTSERPDKEGGEIKDEGEGREIKHITKEDRTDSEVREATDEVPALKSPKTSSLGRALRREEERKSSGWMSENGSEAGWSDRDWADSEVDSDDPDVVEGRKRMSGEGWNWTQAIVGKGAGLQSPKGGTDKSEIESFLRGESKSPGPDGKGRGSGMGLGRGRGDSST